MADIYIKKQDLETDIFFDAIVENNDLLKDNTFVTAFLMCIFTDGSKKQIGTQIDGKIIGNKKYNLDKLSSENIKAYENGILESLQWLIDDSIVISITIETQKEGNLLKVAITFKVDAENEINLIYSLDENLEILN